MDNITEFRIHPTGNEEAGGFHTGEQEISPTSLELNLKEDAQWQGGGETGGMEEMLEVGKSIQRL